MGIHPYIKYPGYDEAQQQQKFPFKTFAMVTSALTHLLISSLAAYVFRNIMSPDKWDVLNAFPDLHIHR